MHPTPSQQPATHVAPQQNKPQEKPRQPPAAALPYAPLRTPTLSPPILPFAPDLVLKPLPPKLTWGQVAGAVAKPAGVYSILATVGGLATFSIAAAAASMIGAGIMGTAGLAIYGYFSAGKCGCHDAGRARAAEVIGEKRADKIIARLWGAHMLVLAAAVVAGTYVGITNVKSKVAPLPAPAPITTTTAPTTFAPSPTVPTGPIRATPPEIRRILG